MAGITHQGPSTKSGSFFGKKRKTRSKRKSSKKSSKPMMIKTTQRTLVPVPDAEEIGMVIQLDKALSESNYKLYRQGMNYHAKVSLAPFAVEDANNTYKIYTLPTDHRTIGALRMARAIYNQAVKDELEIRPEVKTPWTDFKIDIIGPGLDPAASTMYTNESRVRRLGASLATGANETVYLRHDSYEMSEITSNAGSQKRFSLVDFGSATHWNVFQEYRNYLINRADPDSASETPAYPDASAVLTEMAELADKGDEPPYAWDFTQEQQNGTDYGGAFLNLQLAGTLSGDTFPDLTKNIVLQAPLGLIFVICDDVMSNTQGELIITALPGNYKGVKADKLYKTDKLLGF